MSVIALRVSRSKYPKWKGSSTNYKVIFDFRPLLDKWDVSFLHQRYAGQFNWYMYEKCERFSTKLEALKFIMDKFGCTEVHLQDRYSPEFEIYTVEGVNMINKAVETLTLVYGKDSRFVTDSELFAHIKRVEGEIKGLESICNKPKRLEQRIAELQSDIDKLVQVVDGR